MMIIADILDKRNGRHLAYITETHLLFSSVIGTENTSGEKVGTWIGSHKNGKLYGKQGELICALAHLNPLYSESEPALDRFVKLVDEG